MNKSIDAQVVQEVDPSTYNELIPKLERWPIYRLNANRDQYIKEITNDTLGIIKDLLKYKDDPLKLASEAYNLEMRRIKSKKWKVDPPNEKVYWEKIRKQITSIQELSMDDPNREVQTDELLRTIIHHFASEIAGGFKVKTFMFMRRILPIFYSILFKKFFSTPLGFWTGKKEFNSKFRISGPVEKVRALFDKGCVVLLPTHSSNLDSIFIGYTADRFLKMPGFYYGAGLNLFNSEVAAYYMNRLGAYRVDRRKKNTIYLETLKMASRVAIRMQVNSLFFPGGTRSRSGKIEDKLKLGLMSTVIEAQYDLIKENSDKKVFIVPVDINYPNVLEASELYREDIRKNDAVDVVLRRIKQPSLIKRIWTLVKNLFFTEMTNYISLGEPMDVFGNSVDAAGNSIGINGKDLELADYFKTNDVLHYDAQRTLVYCRHLAEQVAQSYKDQVIIMPGNICALAFLLCKKKEMQMDEIQDFVFSAEEDWSIAESIFNAELYQLIEQLEQKAEAGHCKFSNDFRDLDLDKIKRIGMKQLSAYHNYDTLSLKREEIKTKNPGLLVFYGNRLVHLVC